MNKHCMIIILKRDAHIWNAVKPGTIFQPPANYWRYRCFVIVHHGPISRSNACQVVKLDNECQLFGGFLGFLHRLSVEFDTRQKKVGAEHSWLAEDACTRYTLSLMERPYRTTDEEHR